MTWKHGGPAFLVSYVAAMFIVGIPILILEITLGQKMQRGAAGALRGITPRLAGVGWAASFAGFIVVIIYNIMLSIIGVYMVTASKEPWLEKGLDRPIGCSTAAKAEVPPEELYLYMNVTKLISSESCEAYADGDNVVFATELFVAVIITWVIVWGGVIRGPKTI